MAKTALAYGEPNHDRLIKELESQVRAEDMVCKAWASAPFSEYLHGVARQAVARAAHFENAIRAIRML
jgi:histone H3/H4